MPNYSLNQPAERARSLKLRHPRPPVNPSVMQLKLGKLFFAAILGSLVAASCAPGSLGGPSLSSLSAATRQTVHKLGTESVPEDAVRELHTQGRGVVPALIAELHVVDPAVYDSDWSHVVWCERALRSITGQRFEFVSVEPLSAGLAEFRGPKEPLAFVSERMANGAILVAPRDVQAKVIASWREWCVTNCGSFPFQAYEPFGAWYW